MFFPYCVCNIFPIFDSSLLLFCFCFFLFLFLGGGCCFRMISRTRPFTQPLSKPSTSPLQPLCSLRPSTCRRRTSATSPLFIWRVSRGTLGKTLTTEPETLYIYPQRALWLRLCSSYYVATCLSRLVVSGIEETSAIVDRFRPLLSFRLLFFFKFFAHKIFHLDVHYVFYVKLVQRFEPQGRRFTNFHHCHYYYVTVARSLSLSVFRARHIRPSTRVYS